MPTPHQHAHLAALWDTRAAALRLRAERLEAEAAALRDDARRFSLRATREAIRADNATLALLLAREPLPLPPPAA